MLVDMNGLALNVEITGSGRPLLLLHGFTGSARSWDRFVPGWSKDYEVIAVDLIGHGESAAPDDPERYTMECAVDDLTALMDALGLASAAVLGYSMGGRVALSLAAMRPERVSALLLESSSPGLASAEERKARVAADEALAARIEAEGVEAFVRHWESIPLFASLKAMPEEVQGRIREQRLRNRAKGLAHSLRGMGTGRQPSWWDALPMLPMPVLVTAGELDQKFIGIAQRMKDQIADCRFVPVRSAGHMVHVEQAETFDTIVREFLIHNG